MLITKDEATAGQRTITFYAVDATDGFTPEAGIDFNDAGDVKVSKAGAALANATGVVTELATGMYKLVLSAGDVNTLGELSILITNAGVRPIVLGTGGSIQIVAIDPNDAAGMADGSFVAAKFGAGAVNAAAIAADALTAAKVAADVTTELQNGLATAAGVAAVAVGTVNRPFAMGLRTTDGNFTACGMENAIKTEITVAGTWNGATVTGQVSQDLVSWQNKGTPLTADGVITLTGPAKAFRAVLSDDGASTSLTANAQIVNPVT